MANQTQPTGIALIRKEFNTPQVINMFRDAMPKAIGKQAEEAAKRFSKMTYTAISQNPQLQKCSIKSLIRAASISASLDLDIDARGLAYLVPYNGEAQFQIGYLGLIELAYRSGKVKAISAHCIYESEKDSVKIIRKDGQYTVEHPFSYEQPSGKMIAVYATAIVDGIDPVTCVLRADQIEYYRKKSKAPNSPAWKDFYEAMAKKTAIRQLAKFLPKSILDEFSRGAAVDEKEDFVSAQEMAQTMIGQQAGSEVINTNFEDIPTQLPAEGERTPEQQAKIDKEKEKLNSTSGKTRTKKNTTKKKPDSKYICRDCQSKKRPFKFDTPLMSGPEGRQTPICPNKECLSMNIVETKAQPEFMTDD